MKLHVSILFLVFVLFPLVGIAQFSHRSDHQWEDMKRLEAGKKITVSVALAGDIYGTFVRVQENNFYMDNGREQIRLKRENIKSIVTSEHKKRHAPVIGALIGFAAGAIVGNYMARQYGSDNPGMATIIFGGMTAGSGYMVGSLLAPPPGPNVIYQTD